MDSRVKSQINELAEVIQTAYNIQAPIKDMKEVVKILGGDIEFCNDVIDGCIEKKGNSFVIRLSENIRNQLRMRFTIAHELGHLFLHMGYKIAPNIWNKVNTDSYNRFGFSKEEAQANEFAAAFLMPKNLYVEELKKCIDMDGYVDIKKLANFFKVSQLAAVNRGKNLNVIME